MKYACQTSTHMATIQHAIAPLKTTITQHPLLPQLGDLNVLRTFMTQHVFVVWDFVNLIKALHSQLTATQPPWWPANDAQAVRLLYEILIEEETDTDPDPPDQSISHLDLYLRAMDACDADTGPFESCLLAIQQRMPIAHALQHPAITYGGLYADNTQGLPLSSPLSPLLGALYLKPLDEAMQNTGLFYRRYMDDYVILSPKRWPLKRAIQRHHAVLKSLKLAIRPEKTRAGRVEKGFSFLGYRLSPTQLNVASKTQHRCLQKIRRLLQQKRDRQAGLTAIKRWCRWANSGLHGHVAVRAEDIKAFSHLIQAEFHPALFLGGGIRFRLD